MPGCVSKKIKLKELHLYPSLHLNNFMKCTVYIDIVQNPSLPLLFNDYSNNNNKQLYLQQVSGRCGVRTDVELPTHQSSHNSALWSNTCTLPSSADRAEQQCWLHHHLPSLTANYQGVNWAPSTALTYTHSQQSAWCISVTATSATKEVWEAQWNKGTQRNCFCHFVYRCGYRLRHEPKHFGKRQGCVKSSFPACMDRDAHSGTNSSH